MNQNLYQHCGPIEVLRDIKRGEKISAIVFLTETTTGAFVVLLAADNSEIGRFESPSIFSRPAPAEGAK
jgi:hypothetical protein